MSLLAIILVLALEQIHPLPVQRAFDEPVRQLAQRLDETFNDGGQQHGVIAWLLGVALPSLLLMALLHGLAQVQPVIAFLAGLGALYLTIGFRQFSHFFTEIHLCLHAGEIDQARKVLAAWRGRHADRAHPAEIARLAIEQALLSSHRHVFAPLLWFVMLGPAGALFYRLALCFHDAWGNRDAVEFGRFGQWAKTAFGLIDWLPLRVTAATFAIVGNFEDAVHCWRTQARRWPDGGSGILLASGAGALGVRLGMPVQSAVTGIDDIGDRPESGMGEEADTEFMQSTIGLVWRSLVLAVGVLALIWVSGWVGG